MKSVESRRPESVAPAKLPERENPELQDRLRALFAAGYPVVSIQTPEEDFALEIVKSVSIPDPAEVWRWSAVSGLVSAEMEVGEAVSGTENAAAALACILGKNEKQIVITLDLLPHTEDKSVRRAVRDLAARFDNGAGQPGGHLVMIDHSGSMPVELEDLAVPFVIPLPDDTELEKILRKTLSKFHHGVSNIEIDISRRQLDAMVRNLRGLTRKQAERIVIETVADDRKFTADDMPRVLEAKRKLFSGAGTLEFVDKPADLSKVGGMRNLKRWLTERERAFDDEATRFGISPPRGVLMLGVQGTGKSLCAKAIATAWERPLLRLDAGSLYNSYIGESERRLRAALRQAESIAPAVLWIDEIEKAFSSAASSSNDGGLSRRMFGALLTWMQEHTAPVFLVATANDIDALPPELLRKGRFDEIFFVDLPTEEVRAEIIGIHLRKRDRDPGTFDVERLAKISHGFSAAELEQAVVSALHGAFAAKREGSAEGDDPLTTEMIEHAIATSPPLSVTAAEKVRALQEWARDRCVPAD